jgi:hypothetical protein
MKGIISSGEKGRSPSVEEEDTAAMEVGRSPNKEEVRITSREEVGNNREEGVRNPHRMREGRGCSVEGTGSSQKRVGRIPRTGISIRTTGIPSARALMGETPSLEDPAANGTAGGIDQVRERRIALVLVVAVDVVGGVTVGRRRVCGGRKREEKMERTRRKGGSRLSPCSSCSRFRP